MDGLHHTLLEVNNNNNEVNNSVICAANWTTVEIAYF